MELENKNEIERLGAKLMENRSSSGLPHKKALFSSETRMNHDKRAETGRKILREKIFGRV